MKPGGLVTSVIFVSTLIVVIISLIPAVFPALMTRMSSNFEDSLNVNPFEFGLLALPILSTNAIVLTLVVVHHKNKLPQKITNAIKFVFNFEISSQVAFLVFVIITGFYIMASIGELFNNKFDSDYYGIFKPWLETFDVFTLPDNQLNRDFGHHVQLFFEVISMKVFGNYKVIPFIASIASLIVIYFLTLEISKKRFAGIISVIVTVQSSVFLFYDTSVSYTNLWVLFYLLALYTIYKKWQLSTISFILATLSKGLTSIFLPVTLFFIYRAEIPSRKKVIIIISYIIMAGIGIGFLSITGAKLNPVSSKSFDVISFLNGFTSFGFGFVHDVVIVSFLLSLIIGLFIVSKRGNAQADSIMLIILIMLASAPFLSALSVNQNLPYRFVPLVVFFSIGVGVILSKRPIE